MNAHDYTLHGVFSTNALYRNGYYDWFGTYIVTGNQRYSSNMVHPLYNEVVACGPLIKGDHIHANPWSYAIQEDHLPVGSISYDSKTFSQQISGAVGGFIPNPSWGYSLDLENAKLQARNKAIKKFYSKMGFAGTGFETDVGEIAQTARMLEDTAKGLIRPVKAFSTLSRSLLSRWGGLRIPANAYLGYIFGIKPIIEDIGVILKVIATRTETPFPIREKASAKASWIETQAGFKMDYNFEAHCTIGALVDVVDQNVYDQVRMGILSPATLAWELLPFSFIADWVVGVGDFLTSREQALRNGCTLSNGYESMYCRTNRSGYYSRDTRDNDGNSFSAYADVLGTKKEFNRILMTSFPSPLAPSIKVTLGSERLVTLGALLSQKLPSTRRWFR